MDTINDNLLIKRISERDTSALSEFYDIHSKYLYTIIYYILKDESEAEDLLQEVFLQIWDKTDSSGTCLGVYYTKNTPIHCAKFSYRNIISCVGPFIG